MIHQIHRHFISLICVEELYFDVLLVICRGKTGRNM